MYALEVTGLRKSFGDHVAVDDLSFHVEHGEIFGLIGPNGAGKTTAMLMIIGMLGADAGSILLEGQSFESRSPEMRRHFGVVPQELAIYPNLTAVQNLRFFGALNGLQGPRLQERVDYVLDLIGLAKNADHTPSTFSGGMQRRLNFGIALLHEPKFVVLDEPTVGIDPQSRSKLLDCVRELGHRGVGVLYASHYMEEIAAVCHRVAIIDRGRLLKQGTPEDLVGRTQIELWITVAALSPELTTQLGALAEVRPTAEGLVTIIIREESRANQQQHSSPLLAVLEQLEQAKIPVLAIKSQETSLETVFLSLTGRTLRD